eukprot:gene43833-53601_t
MQGSYVLRSRDVAQGCPGFLCPSSVTFSPGGKVMSYIFVSPEGRRQVYFTLLEPTSPSPQITVAEDCPFAVTILPALSDAESFTQFTLSLSPRKPLAGLSLAEQLRRERARDMGSGLAACEWAVQTISGGFARMLLPLSDCLYLFDYCALTGQGSVVCVYDGSAAGGAGAPIDPHLSPDGLSLCFVLETGPAS